MRATSFVKSYFSTFLEFSKHCQYGFALCLMESIFMGIYYYLSIYFVDILHIDISTSGIIISCYGIGAIIGGIVGGKLSDRLTPGIVSTFSLFIQAIAYFVFTTISSPTLLMINVFVLGIASYGFITANHLFVLGHCEKGENQRLKGLGILSMASNLGLGLSAIILGEFLSIGFHAVFMITALFIFLLALLSSYYEIKTKTISRKISNDVNHQTPSAQTDHRVFIMTLFCVFFIGMIIAQLGITYTIYIKEIFPSWGLQSVAILFALNSFIVVFASTLICEYIKEYNKLVMLGLGGFLIGFGMFLLIFSHWFVISLSCITFTLGEIIFFAIAQLLCYQCGRENKKGSSLGLYRVVYASTRVLGPAAGSWIYFQFGSNILWAICALIGAVCMLSCILLHTLVLTQTKIIENFQ